MTIRRYDLNGAGERYYSQPYIKPTPYKLLTDEQQRLRILGWPTSEGDWINGAGPVYKSPGLIDPSQVVVPDGTVQVVETTNGNGETVQAAIDENGEVIATKKVPPNIVPIALAAAAAWFFLM